MQARIEHLLKSQARIRELYRAGKIQEAMDEYDSAVLTDLGAVDHRVRNCAYRISRSFIQMVDEDILGAGQASSVPK